MYRISQTTAGSDLPDRRLWRTNLVTMVRAAQRRPRRSIWTLKQPSLDGQQTSNGHRDRTFNASEPWGAWASL